MKRFEYLLQVTSVASFGFLGAASAGAATCESMAGLSLPDVTISAAGTIPAGSYTAANGQTFSNLPTFCRVAATAAPTGQSQINFEVWMPPAGTWNGIFRGEGSGGSAGSITFPLMANAIQRNYATMSTTTGTPAATGRSPCSPSASSISATGRSTSRLWQQKRYSGHSTKSGPSFRTSTVARRAATTR